MSCNNVVVMPKQTQCVRVMVGIKIPVHVPELDIYVTHDEIDTKLSYKLDKEKLPLAIEQALSKAKASGEFDGEKGDRGEKG